MEKERIKWDDVTNVVFVDGVQPTKKSAVAVYAICDDRGKLIEEGVNSKVDWQIEIEAYAILKAINYAVEKNIKAIKIKSDCEPIVKSGGFLKGKTSAGKYLWVAKKIAKDNGIKFKMEWVSGNENLADSFTR